MNSAERARQAREVFAAAEALMQSGEVISAKQAAELGGVTAITIATWRKRHADFPDYIDAPNLCGREGSGKGGHRRALLIRSEFVAWLVKHADRQNARAEAIAAATAKRQKALEKLIADD